VNRRQFLGGLSAAIALAAMPPTLGAFAAPAPLPAFQVFAERRPDYRFMFQVVVRWEHAGREWYYGDLLDEYNDRVKNDIVKRAEWAWARRLHG
jgi:hypothetical protein